MSGSRPASLLQRALARAGLLHFLPHRVQIVGRGNDWKEQEEQAGQRNGELQNRRCDAAALQPQVNGRAEKQETTQVEK